MVRICNYVKTVIAFERDKSIILIEAFQDCCISSFNEGNVHSLLFITSSLGASFSLLLRRQMGLHVGYKISSLTDGVHVGYKMTEMAENGLLLKIR